MFVDKVQVKFVAGKGGDGKLSFRHEKYVERGGPDGGDGGDGGDVVVVASNNENTLAAFRYQKELMAEAGKSGEKRKKHGKSGKSLEVKLPVGTVVSRQDGTMLIDLVQVGQKVVIAEGGRGGFGNAHFASSRRQAPRVAEIGEPGQVLEATLELKMVADVGLVGLPNAGKSTLLSRISNAHPEVADYPFTTLRPHLGVVDVNNTSLLVADIPGLIEGASQGKGLGDEFLRHVERTSVLIHLIDAYQEDIVNTYQTIQQELKDYRVDLSKRPQIIALSKTEGLPNDMIKDITTTLRQTVPSRIKILPISAQSGAGLDNLLKEASKAVESTRRKQAKQPVKEDKLPVLRLEDDSDAWQIKEVKGGFVVTGAKIERFASQTDFSNPAGLERLRDIMRKMGIMHELERKKINPGDIIQVGYGRQKIMEY